MKYGNNQSKQKTDAQDKKLCHIMHPLLNWPTSTSLAASAMAQGKTKINCAATQGALVFKNDSLLVDFILKLSLVLFLFNRKVR